MQLDRRIFDPLRIEEETTALNRSILAKYAGLPDPSSVPPAVIRERRRQGFSPFPMQQKFPRAEMIEIEGKGVRIPLRIIAPPRPSGVYLHIHGGGWMFGSCDEQDEWLERLARNCGLACVSVEYRLAPENPYPAAPDDCEAAALWLVRECQARFGTQRLFIGGESAGGYLAVMTLLRVRDRLGTCPFAGANLLSGCYDLMITPSAQTWGEERLILNTPDVHLCIGNFCPPGIDRRSPAVSPLRADLRGMPPAHISVGTLDPLLDDSLFLAARWTAAGAAADLAVWPGGCHVFMRFQNAMTEAASLRVERFLNGL
jgi:acetyl esterase